MTVLVETAPGLARVVDRAARALRIAVDVEADGLHAYRAKLCTVQLAWLEGDGVEVAVIDALAVSVAPLAPLLGEAGPVKVLHDLTFDARLLAECGAPLGRVRDTSVAARILGFAATGLAALLAQELGITHPKALQQHDWSRRPLARAELSYLAGDVDHLLELDDRLAERAEALDLAPEIADECAYKLASAMAPREIAPPSYTRIKGAAGLDDTGRAVLRRLALARERAAEAADVPPFKIIGNDILLELAEKRPVTMAGLLAVRGATSGNAGRFPYAWLHAISAGMRDGAPPDEDRAIFAPPPPDRAEITRRRAREAQITSWRRAEAARRGVNEQAVLPGHCAQELANVLADHDAHPDGAGLREAIRGVPGLGARRIERYLEMFVTLAETQAKKRA